MIERAGKEEASQNTAFRCTRREFSWRYQLPEIVTLPPAGALGIALILARVGSRWPAAADAPTGLAVTLAARGPAAPAR